MRINQSGQEEKRNYSMYAFDTIAKKVGLVDSSSILGVLESCFGDVSVGKATFIGLD